MSILSLWGFDDSFGEPGVSGGTYVAGRSGGLAYRVSSSIKINFDSSKTSNHIVIGAAYTQASLNNGSFCRVYDTVSANNILRVNGNYSTLNMDIVDRTGVVVGSVPYANYSSSWAYVEFDLIATSTGSVTVYIEGVNMGTFNGNFANPVPNVPAYAIFQSGMAGGTVDDMYLGVVDGLGIPLPLGDVFVKTIPVNNNGTLSQWTNSNGTHVDNYSYIDELPSSATQYVEAATTGLEDNYQNPGVGALTPLAVQPIALGFTNTAGSSPIVALTLNDGTEVADTLGPFTTSPVLFNGLVHETTPSGGGWTEAGLLATKVGIKT